MINFFEILASGYISFVFFWPVGVLATLLFVIALFTTKKKKKIFSKNNLKIFIPFLSASLFISLIGSLFFDTRSNLAIYLTLVILLILAIYEAIIIYKMKGFRLFYLGFLSLLFMYILGNFIFAQFMIANDWM